MLDIKAFPQVLLLSIAQKIFLSISWFQLDNFLRTQSWGVEHQAKGYGHFQSFCYINEPAARQKPAHPLVQLEPCPARNSVFLLKIVSQLSCIDWKISSSLGLQVPHSGNPLS